MWRKSYDNEEVVDDDTPDQILDDSEGDGDIGRLHIDEDDDDNDDDGVDDEDDDDDDGEEEKNNKIKKL